MTNDRAVEILKAIIFMLKNDDYSDEVEEAIHKAIEALKAQESKQDADDTISRKAAIKAIDVKNVNKGIISALQSIIEELPTAEPETHEKRTETHACDCIERQAAIDALYDWSEHSMTDAEAWHIRQVIGDIKSMPSAQPERKTGRWLIREGISDAQCSECKMYFNDVYDMENSDAFCRHCGAKMEGLKVVEDE